MPNCSNCGQKVVGKPAICPKCGLPTRIDSPGFLGGNTLEFAFLGIFILVCIIVLPPLFASAKLASKKSAILSRAKHVSSAVALYLADFDEKFPPMDSSDSIADALSTTFLKQKEEIDSVRTYQWNVALSQMNLSDIQHPVSVWMFFTPPIGNGNVVAATAATNVKYRSESELEGLREVSTEELKASRIQKH